MKPTDCSTNTDDIEDFAQEQSGYFVSDIHDRILNAAIRILLDRPSRAADACEKWRGKGLKQSPNKRYLFD